MAVKFLPTGIFELARAWTRSGPGLGLHRAVGWAIGAKHLGILDLNCALTVASSPSFEGGLEPVEIQANLLNAQQAARCVFPTG